MSETNEASIIPIAPAQAGPVPDDLDHDFPVPDETEDNPIVPPTIPNEMEAERHLKAVGYYQREQKRIREHAEAHRRQIDAWERDRLHPIQARLDWHEGGLRVWFGTVGRKSVKLVYGTLKLVTGRERVEVQDMDSLVSFAKAEHPALIRVKEEAEKTAIRAYIQATGEIPPGVDLVRGEDTIKIETA